MSKIKWPTKKHCTRQQKEIV